MMVSPTPFRFRTERGISIGNLLTWIVRQTSVSINGKSQRGDTTTADPRSENLISGSFI